MDTIEAINIGNEQKHHMNVFKDTQTPEDNNQIYTKKYFTAAIKIPTVGTEVNVAARLRWFWTILKKIDNDLIFLQYNIKDGDNSLKQIQDDEKTIKRYFKNIRDKKGMLRCGFHGA